MSNSGDEWIAWQSRGKGWRTGRMRILYGLQTLLLHKVDHLDGI